MKKIKIEIDQKQIETLERALQNAIAVTPVKISRTVVLSRIKKSIQAARAKGLSWKQIAVILGENGLECSTSAICDATKPKKKDNIGKGKQPAHTASAVSPGDVNKSLPPGHFAIKKDRDLNNL